MTKKLIKLKLLDALFIVLEASETEGGFVTEIELNKNHIVYSGHFPGHPVTPGVIQMQIVHELLEKHLKFKIKFVAMKQCKFLKILNPVETSRITVQIQIKQVNGHFDVNASGENNTGIFFKLKADYIPFVPLQLL